MFKVAHPQPFDGIKTWAFSQSCSQIYNRLVGRAEVSSKTDRKIAGQYLYLQAMEFAIYRAHVIVKLKMLVA